MLSVWLINNFEDMNELTKAQIDDLLENISTQLCEKLGIEQFSNHHEIVREFAIKFYLLADGIKSNEELDEMIAFRKKRPNLW